MRLRREIAVLYSAARNTGRRPVFSVLRDFAAFAVCSRLPRVVFMSSVNRLYLLRQIFFGRSDWQNKAIRGKSNDFNTAPGSTRLSSFGANSKMVEWSAMQHV